MKFLRFLWGFICGIWTLLVAVLGFLLGYSGGYGVGKDYGTRTSYISPSRVSYDKWQGS